MPTCGSRRVKAWVNVGECSVKAPEHVKFRACPDQIMNTLEPAENTHERFRIGDLELDTGTVTLRRGGEEIALPGLSFELLLCLARHAPNVVSADTLMNEVWGEVVVGEETVKQRVKLLRKALGDDSTDPRYITAVRGRGYRLIAKVSEMAGRSEPGLDRKRTSKSFSALLISGVILLAAALVVFLVSRDDALTNPVPAISQQEDRTATDSEEAWQAYLNGREAYRRWTPLDNETALAFFQRAIELDPDFALALAGAANANALRATQFGSGEEWIDEAIALARRALELEPELPEALKALGICYVHEGRYQTALDYFRNALRINPDYDEVLFNIAELMHFTGHWDEAVQFQQRDAQRPQGLARLSTYLRDLGFDQRAETLAQAFEKDLPLSFLTDANLSLHLLLNGEFEQASEYALSMQRAIPSAADGWLRAGEIDLMTGDEASAIKNFETAMQTGGGFEDYSRLRVAQMKLLAGDIQDAELLLKTVELSAQQAIANGHEGWFHRWHLAVLNSLSRDSEEALDWFEKAVESGRRRYEWDEMEPAFQTIRNESRFRAAIQQQKDLRQEMWEVVRQK